MGVSAATITAYQLSIATLRPLVVVATVCHTDFLLVDGGGRALRGVVCALCFYLIYIAGADWRMLSSMRHHFNPSRGSRYLINSILKTSHV